MWCHTHQCHGRATSAPGMCWYGALTGSPTCDLHLAMPADHLSVQQTGQRAAYPASSPDQEHR